MLGLGNKATTSKGQVTASSIPPIVALYDATNITDSSATLSAAFSANPTTTARGFEYDTNEDFSTKTTINLASGSSPTSANLTGLTETTVYYYRFFATNSVGTTTSAAKSFTSARSVAPEAPSNSDWEVFHQWDFSVAVDANGNVDGFSISPNYGALDSNQDGVTDNNGVSKDNCLLASKALTDDDSLGFFIVSDFLNGIESSDRYKLEFDIYVPSSTDQHGGINYITLFGRNYFTSASYDNYYTDDDGNNTMYLASDKGTWGHVVLDKINDTPTRGTVLVRLKDLGSTQVTGAESDSEFYMTNMVLYKYIGS
jgi:hypothetical protein